MTTPEQRAFFESIRQREFTDLDLPRVLNEAKLRAGTTPAIADALTSFATEIGKMCWDAGFWAGCNAGLEVAQEINAGRWK